MANINIQDDSGDKEFFTIIPNYIANHSTANDQALYLQMKKHAGEEGKCFATSETLMKKLSIGRKSFNKSLDYLLKKGWISYIGMTEGKTRPIKTYKVNNIWKLNTEYYKKISSESTLSTQKKKDKSQKKGDKSQKNTKISAERTVEEEPVLIRTNNNNIDGKPSRELNKQVKELFNYFYENINPNLSFNQKPQWDAGRRLIEKYGLESCLRLAEIAKNGNSTKYAPTITTVYELEKKLAKLLWFYKKEDGSNEKSKIGKI